MLIDRFSPVLHFAVKSSDCLTLLRVVLMLQEEHGSSPKFLVYSALVACSLYLLTGFISAQWHDLVHVLIVHPKVHIYFCFTIIWI